MRHYPSKTNCTRLDLRSIRRGGLPKEGIKVKVKYHRCNKINESGVWSFSRTGAKKESMGYWLGNRLEQLGWKESTGPMLMKVGEMVIVVQVW